MLPYVVTYVAHWVVYTGGTLVEDYLQINTAQNPLLSIADSPLLTTLWPASIGLSHDYRWVLSRCARAGLCISIYPAASIHIQTWYIVTRHLSSYESGFGKESKWKIFIGPILTFHERRSWDYYGPGLGCACEKFFVEFSSRCNVLNWGSHLPVPKCEQQKINDVFHYLHLYLPRVEVENDHQFLDLDPWPTSFSFIFCRLQPTWITM